MRTVYLLQPLTDIDRLAIMRDHTKLLTLGRSAPAITKSQIQIYSPAGESLLVFSVDIQTILMYGLANDGLPSGTKAESPASGGRLMKSWLS